MNNTATSELSATAPIRSTDGLSGVELIRRERARQISKEGWTPDHDDTHTCREMAKAAACYAVGESPVLFRGTLGGGPHFDSVPRLERLWPWEKKWWKPKSQLENLIRAGALIAAEIDRLKRQEKNVWLNGRRAR